MRASPQAAALNGAGGRAGNGISVELLRAADPASAHRDAWQFLADRAVDPNVFYEPGFALGAVRCLPGHAQVIFAFVWEHRDDDSRRTLAALIPIPLQRRWPLCQKAAVAWRHHFAVLTTPLLAHGTGEVALRAFFDCLASLHCGPRYVIWPLLSDGSQTAQAIRNVSTCTQRSTSVVVCHHRAQFICGSHPGSRISIPVKRQKEVQRQRRRLGETAAVVRTTASDGQELASAVEGFLNLEAAGWKGRSRTAALVQPGVADFTRTVIAKLGEAGKARIDGLRHGGKLVAALVTLRSGNRGFLWKIAYSEERASQAPGVQLLCEATDTFVADRAFPSVDSCAVPGHRLIESLWRDRLAIADRLVFVRPNDSWITMSRGLTSEMMRQRAVTGLKRIYSTTRRILKPVLER